MIEFQFLCGDIRYSKMIEVKYQNDFRYFKIKRDYSLSPYSGSKMILLRIKTKHLIED